MDHIGQRIPLLPALSHHLFHSLPGIPALFHHTDDLQDRLDFSHVLLDQLRLTSISLLLLNQFLNTLFLILTDLLILLPGQLFEGLLLLMRRVLVFAEVLSYCETETFLLGAGPFREFAVTERRELEVFLALRVEVPWLLLTQKGFKELEAMPGSLQCGLFPFLIFNLSIGIEPLGDDDMFDDCGMQAGNHLENDILNLLSALILSLPFLLALRSLGLSLLSLRLSLPLLRLQLFLQSFSRNIYILNINISRILERIDLSNSSFNLLVELMRPNTLQDTIMLVSEYDIPLGI